MDDERGVQALDIGKARGIAWEALAPQRGAEVFLPRQLGGDLRLDKGPLFLDHAESLCAIGKARDYMGIDRVGNAQLEDGEMPGQPEDVQGVFEIAIGQAGGDKAQRLGACARRIEDLVDAGLSR